MAESDAGTSILKWHAMLNAFLGWMPQPPTQGSDRLSLAWPSQGRASVREPRRPTGTRHAIMQMGQASVSSRISNHIGVGTLPSTTHTGRAHAPAPPRPSPVVERVDIPYTTATSILFSGSRDKPKHQVPWGLLSSKVGALQQRSATQPSPP